MRPLMIVTLLIAAAAVSFAGPVDDVNALLDAWHRASAVADEDAYFGAMADDCVFLGTDATERWLRDELRAWAEPHFVEAPAWAFTVASRNVYFDATGTVAWFEEMLETGMGPCRASGVLTFADGTWLIRHYDLALTVPNEHVDALKELVADHP